jgi:hypothetical protein
MEHCGLPIADCGLLSLFVRGRPFGPFLSSCSFHAPVFLATAGLHRPNPQLENLQFGLASRMNKSNF